MDAVSVTPPASVPVTPARSLSPARRDLLLIVVFSIGFYLLAGRLELAERIVEWGGRYEHWDVDELPLVLLLVSIGLAWFALRRAVEAQREIAERRRAQSLIAELLARNRDLAQRLIHTQESERRALARELHDEMAQNCTAIRAEASYIIHARHGDHAGIVGSAERIAGVAENLYSVVKNMLRRLRPMALDSLGLVPALQELCESWEEQTGIACNFFPQEVPHELDDSTRITLYRLVQEALTNIARHAKAESVRIELRTIDQCTRLSLSIEDDGCGIDADERLHGGFGVIGMRERVAGLQGDIQFRSTPGKGLRIDVELPVFPSTQKRSEA